MPVACAPLRHCENETGPTLALALRRPSIFVTVVVELDD